MCVSLFAKLFTWFWGGLDGRILALTAFVVVEAFSSILLTISKGFERKNCKEWLAKKVTMFLIVGIGNITDCYLTSGSNTFRTLIILFYAGYEGAVILKNAKALGLPVPQKMTKFLMDLCDTKDNST